MPSIARIDSDFYNIPLTFGLPRDDNENLTYTIGINLFGNLSAVRGDGDRNLKGAVTLLNQAIDKVQKNELDLRDFQVVTFADNCEKLNHKVTRWNEKVNNSQWVAFLDKLLWIITCSGYQFKQTLLIDIIDTQKLSDRKIASEAKIKSIGATLSTLTTSIYRASLARSYFGLIYDTTRIQASCRAYLARRHFQESRKGFAAKFFGSVCGNIGGIFRGAIGNLSRLAVRQIAIHGPRLIIKHGFRLAMVQMSIACGVDPSLVLAQQRSMDMVDEMMRNPRVMPL